MRTRDGSPASVQATYDGRVQTLQAWETDLDAMLVVKGHHAIVQHVHHRQLRKVKLTERQQPVGVH